MYVYIHTYIYIHIHIHIYIRICVCIPNTCGVGITFCSSEIELRGIGYGHWQSRCLRRKETAEGRRETPTDLLTGLPPGLWQDARWHMSQ